MAFPYYILPDGWFVNFSRSLCSYGHPVLVGWYVAMRLTLVPEPRAVDNSRDACRSPFTTHPARLTFIFSPVHIRYAPPRVCPGFVWNMCFCHTHTKRRINVAMATRDTYWQYNAILAGTRVKGSFFFLSLLSVNINLKDCTHTHFTSFVRPTSAVEGLV